MREILYTRTKVRKPLKPDSQKVTIYYLGDGNTLANLHEQWLYDTFGLGAVTEVEFSIVLRRKPRLTCLTTAAWMKGWFEHVSVKPDERGELVITWIPVRRAGLPGRA